MHQAELSLKANLEKQKTLEERKKIFNSNAAMVKRKVRKNIHLSGRIKDRLYDVILAILFSLVQKENCL